MANPVIFRYIVFPYTSQFLQSGNTLDAVISSLKALVIGNTIYVQEVHTSDYATYFALLFFLSTAANDAIITATTIPAIAASIGASTLLTFNVNATA